MKKKIVILGSTGSIGTTTINIIKKDKRKFIIKLLSTNKNIKKVYNQAKLFSVKDVIVNDYDSYIKAKKIYKKSNIRFHCSFSIINKLFKKKEIFYSMISTVGVDGLKPSIDLIKYSKNIAIINKESLICGWNLIFKELNKYKTNFFPVDSEHFSIFSLIGKQSFNDIDKIYITASGGPFLNYSFSNLSKVKINEALNHPNWKMGKKISIDSSTMMNKLFEVIEAKKIFNLPYKKIKILIHPKSYIHALVKFNNGITKILLHDPNMRIPIHNSIYHHDNKKLKTKEIDFKILNKLDFQTVNYKKFPLVEILNILPKNDSLFETVLISINDFFVSVYLKKKINYKKLVNLINYHSHSKIFSKFKRKVPRNVNDIYKTKNYVYEKLVNSGI
jgi:1-deoxy-D-xylulose-5-phosphate reductoisomerase|tara:strand:- start:6136 stop:7302 length:1167 start_codon:yes stop_codon:yes gene_type:complete